MRTMSRPLAVMLVIVVVLLLAVAWSQTESFKVLLVVAAVFALLAATLTALTQRSSGSSPQTLTTQASITARLKSLREGASSVSAIWSGEYDSSEVGLYFNDERKALETNELLHIRRVINPAVIPDEHFELLQSIRDRYGERFQLLEDSTLRSFELYIAEYPSESEKDAVAVVVINNTLTKRPQVALVLDPNDDKSLGGAVNAVQKWWETISEDLAPFDPVAIERWDQIASRYTEVVTENAGANEFLDRYTSREREAVGERLASSAEEEYELSLVEVGCGDGRALLSYIPTELERRISYVFGFDYAPAMVEIAESGLARLRHSSGFVRVDAKALLGKTAFFELNAANMRRFFDDGRLHDLEQLLEASPSGAGVDIDYSTYGASRKVFLCLLNTIGVISPRQRRIEVLESILACLGVEDRLILTVFAAERFAEDAISLYRDLEEMINAEVRELQFDSDTATFSIAGSPGSPGYFSQWFSERELSEHFNEATASLIREGRSFGRVEIEPMGSGGYLAVVRRTA